MSDKDTFKIISVTGAQSKVGKTTLCTILLRNLNRFGAIKFTKSSLYTSVTDDPETIMQKEKDTAKMSESGAEKVVWIQSDGDELEDALNIALGTMTELDGVVVEGNSPVDFLEPHLLIFIVGEDGQIKPSALKISKRADIIIINSENRIDNPSFLSPMMKQKTEILRLDLKNRTGEIDKFLNLVNKKIKGNRVN